MGRVLTFLAVALGLGLAFVVAAALLWSVGGPQPVPEAVVTTTSHAFQPVARPDPGAPVSTVGPLEVLDVRTYRIALETGPTTSPDAAREDAFDLLDRRIRESSFRLARSEGRVDDDDRPAFDAVLRDRFPRDLLINLGTLVLDPRTDVFEDGLELHRTGAVWTIERDTLESVTESVADVLSARARAPWVKLGISLGVLLIGAIGWLRIDWWLKGHYSVLTMAATAAVVLVVLGLVWDASWRV